MNKDNVLAVADAIEKHTIPKLGFNMALFYAKSDAFYLDNSGHECGTVACIAGWAYTVKRGRMPRDHEKAEEEACGVAREYFDLNWSVAHSLFYPPYDLRRTITPSLAALVLRHLAETGEVDWSKAA